MAAMAPTGYGAVADYGMPTLGDVASLLPDQMLPTEEELYDAAGGMGTYGTFGY